MLIVRQEYLSSHLVQHQIDQYNVKEQSIYFFGPNFDMYNRVELVSQFPMKQHQLNTYPDKYQANPNHSTRIAKPAIINHIPDKCIKSTKP